MWTKMDRAVSPECNEILVSKKFKERTQKPRETITVFITELMLLVKECNYADEVTQVRDQFVYKVSDEELKKRLLEKGSTLTRVEATAIGKAYESTKLEVQECSAKQPAKDSVKAVSKDKLRKVLMCNYCVNKKGAHSFSDKKLCPVWGAVCRKCKIKNHYQDSNECIRLERERQGKQSDPKHSKSSKKPFVQKVEEDGEHYYEVLDKICVLNQNGDQKKAFANLLLSKKRIPAKFQIDSGSTCRILLANVYKDISGDNDLKDLNTEFKPLLSLYDEETKIQTLGTRKVLVFNPVTEEEVIIQLRILNRAVTPPTGLHDSEILKLIELLREKHCRCRTS